MTYREGMMGRRAKPVRPYAEASAWAQSMGIKSQRDWFERRRLGLTPDDLPASPPQVYKSEWTTWGDFLGTGIAYRQKMPIRSYAEAQSWAAAQGISSRREWMLWCKREDFPEDLPTNPWRSYKSEWTGWGNFLIAKSLCGTSRVEKILKHCLDKVLDLDRSRITRITDAAGPLMHVDMADRGRRLIIEYDGHWWHKERLAQDRRKTERLHEAGWTIIRIRQEPLPLINPVLDLNVVAPSTASSYAELIAAVMNHLNGLINRGALPDHGLRAKIDMALLNPVDAAEYGDILSQGKVPYADLTEVMAWARSEGIRTETEWRRRTKGTDFPKNYPTVPSRAYLSEWKDWGTFLGTGRKRSRRPSPAVKLADLAKLGDGHAQNDDVIDRPRAA
ncbi:DUF559 domain-containing protein [Burkholderia vietnamiensis]|uniref:DUF559 domain-containing protein n=1 Tax=Burkholderia vietnamiensis TaxID=60552 RepID=UPI001CF5F88B|nr:DUF559 domain-containing protein [Burkholderia vietnamiensis]MCA8287626.1 endonuclease domain-containing protein [Burkholderia vietnamiensis]